MITVLARGLRVGDEIDGTCCIEEITHKFSDNSYRVHVTTSEGERIYCANDPLQVERRAPVPSLSKCYLVAFITAEENGAGLKLLGVDIFSEPNPTTLRHGLIPVVMMATVGSTFEGAMRAMAACVRSLAKDSRTWMAVLESLRESTRPHRALFEGD